MRLLAIRFQNLNSLRGTHELNLEHGPLAEAGLFAITGPTGAGKSTILDAVTLALYGRAARYGSSSGESLDVMSRGAGECAAIVEFECAGGRCRAEWSQRRSRAKAEGNYQPVKHSLWRDGVIIEERTTAVQTRVEALTGLDYERFLRSVLLAQGQFAAFLKAGTKERADLLQRITGSQIYAELGRRAHSIAAENAAREREESARLSGITFLSDEERTEITAKVHALSSELSGRAAQEAALRTEVAALVRAKALHESEQLLVSAEAALSVEVKAFEPEAERLLAHAAAAPLADLLRSAGEAQRQAAETEQSLTKAAGALRQAQLAAESAAAAAMAALNAADVTAQHRRTGLAGRIAENREAIQQAAEWVRLHSEDEALAEALPRLAELKTAAGAAESARAEASRQKEAADAKHSAAEQAAVARKAEASGAARRAEESAAAAAQADAALAALLAPPWTAPEAIEAEVSRLARLADALARLHDSERDASRMKAEIARLEEECKTAAVSRDTAAASQKAADGKLDGARREMELLRELVRKEQVIRSLAEHRAHLQNGEPCPLCGSPEHPFAASLPAAQDSAEDRLAQHLKAITALERGRDLCAQNLTASEKAVAAVQAALTARRESLLASRDAAEKVWRTCFPGRVFEPAALESARRETQDAATALSALQQHVRRALKAQSEAATAAAKQSAEAATAGALAHAAERAAAESASMVAETARRLAAAEQTAAAALAALQGFLTDLGEDAVDAESALSRLRGRARQWQEQAELRVRLEKAAAALEHESEKLAADDALRATRRIETREAIAAAGLALPADPAPAAGASNLAAALTALHTARSQANTARMAAEQARRNSAEASAALDAALPGTPFSDAVALRAALLDRATQERMELRRQQIRERTVLLESQRARLAEEKAALAPLPDHSALPSLELELREFTARSLALSSERGAAAQRIQSDDEARTRHAAAAAALEAQRAAALPWARLANVIGDSAGSRFSRFAQSLTLNALLSLANARLHHLCDRYRLVRAGAASDLELQISDAWQGDTLRPMESLSGGETFLVSLALALALSELAGRRTRIATLFIDEGFGTLDPAALDTALSALESLRTAHSTIGIISHVESLKARLSTQVEVVRSPGGWSSLVLKF